MDGFQHRNWQLVGEMERRKNYEQIIGREDTKSILTVVYVVENVELCKRN